MKTMKKASRLSKTLVTMTLAISLFSVNALAKKQIDNYSDLVDKATISESKLNDALESIESMSHEERIQIYNELLESIAFVNNSINYPKKVKEDLVKIYVDSRHFDSVAALVSTIGLGAEVGLLARAENRKKYLNMVNNRLVFTPNSKSLMDRKYVLDQEMKGLKKSAVLVLLLSGILIYDRYSDQKLSPDEVELVIRQEDLDKLKIKMEQIKKVIKEVIDLIEEEIELESF